MKSKIVLGFALTVLLGAPGIQAQTNHGVYLSQTLASGTTIEQRGGLLTTPWLEVNQSYTIGFWIKRDTAADQSSALVKHPDYDVLIGITVLVTISAECEILKVPMSVVPGDSAWHYVFLAITPSSGVLHTDVYVDGAKALTNLTGCDAQTAYADGYYRLKIGALGRETFGVPRDNTPAGSKFATQSNTIIDDFSIWHGATEDLIQLHTDVAEFGMFVMPDNDPRRFSYFNFDTAAESMIYTEDIQQLTVVDGVGFYNASQLAEPTLVDTSANRGSKIRVVTGSAFQTGLKVQGQQGQVVEQVSPGNWSIPADFTGVKTVRVEAPEFIYLDRYLNELGTQDVPGAYYRARNTKAPTVVGATTPHISGLSVEATTDRSFRVSWEWVIEFLGDVETGTESIVGLSAADVTDQPGTLGRNWYGPHVTGKEKFTSTVHATVGGPNASLPVQFAVKGYVLENAPGSPEKYLELPGGSAHLRANNTGLSFRDADRSFSIEFWARLDPGTVDHTRDVIAIGSQLGAEHQIQVGFRASTSADANSFFLGNNIANESLNAPSELTDTDWHHWAAVFDGRTGQMTYYRDGRVIMQYHRHLGFSGNDTLVLGGRADGGHVANVLTGGVNNIRIWSAPLDQAKIRESMGSSRYGPGETNLALEVTFDMPQANSSDQVVSYETEQGLVLSMNEFDAPFPASATTDTKLNALFPGFQYAETAGSGANSVTFVLPSNDHQFPVTDWTRIFWRWEKQFRLDVNVAASDASRLAEVAAFPYLSGDHNVDGSTTQSSGNLGQGVVTVLQEWVAEGDQITVGTIYRTDDRSLTLNGVLGQLNSFGVVTTDSLVDGLHRSKVSREYTFGAMEGPGALTFNFGPTVFRAEVAIGDGFDASTTVLANTALSPQLSGANPVLATGPNGPAVAPPVVDPTGLTTGGTGAPWIWDFAGKKFYPLKPGKFTLTWPDANDPAKTYLIEINAQFPTEQITVRNRENLDGSRQGSPPAYLTNVSYLAASDSFPASPGAHYHYVVSPNTSDPIPADLDENPSDHWAFQRLAFSEDTGAQVAEGSTVFTDRTAGTRTVLAFSYRTNVAEVATGDLLKEAVAVRIVKSLAVSESEAAASGTVGTRITSAQDKAGFGSGYLLYPISNYNPQIYNRGAAVGQWGPIYPVNWSGLYTADNRRLRIAFYENPFLSEPAGVLHPNVAWPYIVANYDTVSFPETNANVIYLASRLGSEGVNEPGADQIADQMVFDPAQFANLSIYNQPDRAQPGYNPNEEHAVIAPSIKDQLTGDNAFNLGQKAAFALQNDINLYGATDADASTTANNAAEFTSEPFVLVQYENLTTGEFEMRAYRVEKTRAGNARFPALDPVTHLPTDSLGQPVPQPANPTYDFEYAAFAGDPVIQPYPLNLVVGNVIMHEDEGGNLQVNGVNRRTLWFDKNENAWIVSGDGQFFHRFWYPFREDFWFDSNQDRISDLNIGTPTAWLPANRVFLASAGAPEPQRVRFDTYWRTDYPVLKRGESMTYAGGEHKAENPLATGLPGIVAWESAQIIFDNLTPSMIFNTYDTLQQYSARVIRPLDRYEKDYEQTDMPEELTPAHTENVLVHRERWYFKALIGSLQKRFYYDSLRQKLVFHGRLNDLEGGDPNLTAQPVALSVLEPNVMTAEDFTALKNLAESDNEWVSAMNAFYLKAQNPSEVTIGGHNPANTDNPVYLPGVEAAASATGKEVCFYSPAFQRIACPSDSNGGDNFDTLDSLGTGAALTPNPRLLTASDNEPLYVTLVENNHAQASGAVTLHIVRISDERFRGAIKMIEAQNVFDEKINLKHSADFGGNTEETYYQWWVRDVASLGSAGLAAENPDWQLYAQGLGLNQIAFTGRPDVALSDKFFYVRYGERGELEARGQNPASGSVADSSWRLVDINDASDNYHRVNGDPVPFQWAGAANSPQLQADGSLAYIPQLIMGWVKRVLDRINPYEARFSDFENNDSPATYSSFLRSAGAPYIGDVALNADKDVIENVGLIQLYETVLNRTKSLTLDIPGASTAGTGQALLLAATRLAEMYELLGREAYSDAQNPTILVTPENGLATAAPYVHAFYNQEASLLHEELALLRGTDFLKAYPVSNRLFWNYVKGLGEAAYNANYQVHDINVDGFINEFDAAIAYPQGHGDAWGHFLSGHKMHYELLRHAAFDWQTRSEYYSLLDNVIPADYLDEKSFARIAAVKARTGKEIVAATYREAYTADPGGQWQGYTDAADPARAWGVSEWAKRAGQGALFDWIVGNALVPEAATDSAAAGDLDLSSAAALDRIDRQANEHELSEIAAACFTIQQTLDGANGGYNPIGLDPDGVVFDLDPLFTGPDWQKSTHFEQVFEKAKFAAQNARATLDYASQADQQLSRLTADADSLKRDAILQDIDYRNRLIAIFGTPYEGVIGPGQIYADGYSGPDLLLYLYIDRVDPNTVHQDSRLVQVRDEDLAKVRKRLSALDFSSDIPGFNNPNFNNIFDAFYLRDPSESVRLGHGLTTEVPVVETSRYALQAAEGWGRRRASGRIQTTLNEMLASELELETSVDTYLEYVQGMLIRNERLQLEAKLLEGKAASRLDFKGGLIALKTIGLTFEGLKLQFEFLASQITEVTRVTMEFQPTVVGLSTDIFAASRGSLRVVGDAAKEAYEQFAHWLDITTNAIDFGAEIQELRHELDEERFEDYSEILELLADLALELQEEGSKRLAIAQQIQRLYNLSLEFDSTVAEGFRLLNERAALNKFIAASAQKDRYQDMMLRLTRNDALAKYQGALDNALRYAWLAAKAYEYETSLDPASPASATTVLARLVKTRQLGNWVDGEPRIGNGGLAEILAQLEANFQTLKGQLFLNNPQFETEQISLRTELFRISQTGRDSLVRWQRALAAAKVPDLWALPEFQRFCRPFANPAGGPQPGLVIEFSTQINPGLNVFGRQLGGGDHAYSTANYATKVLSTGVWFESYDQTVLNDSHLSFSPRIYLVPVGTDVLRVSDSNLPRTRAWNVVQQRIPAPFAINEANLRDPGYIPAIHGLNGSFTDITRFGDFRANPTSTATIADDLYGFVGRTVWADRWYGLVGRSVWNTRWMLIIPGVTLNADPEVGLQRFIDTVTDIQLQFETYSHQGL